MAHVLGSYPESSLLRSDDAGLQPGAMRRSLGSDGEEVLAAEPGYPTGNGTGRQSRVRTCPTLLQGEATRAVIPVLSDGWELLRALWAGRLALGVSLALGSQPTPTNTHTFHTDHRILSCMPERKADIPQEPWLQCLPSPSAQQHGLGSQYKDLSLVTPLLLLVLLSTVLAQLPGSCLAFPPQPLASQPEQALPCPVLWNDRALCRLHAARESNTAPSQQPAGSLPSFPLWFLAQPFCW